MADNQEKKSLSVKLKKIVFTDPSYDWKDKEGNSHKTSFYKLELDSGYSISFKPTNTKDYAVINALCEVVFVDTPKKK